VIGSIVVPFVAECRVQNAPKPKGVSGGSSASCSTPVSVAYSILDCPVCSLVFSG